MNNNTRAVPGSDLSGDPGHDNGQKWSAMALRGGCGGPGYTIPAGAENPGTAVPPLHKSGDWLGEWGPGLEKW